MSHYDGKTFFKDIKKEGQDYSDDISESFPYTCLKIFWDDLSKDEIEDALQGLNTNDESIDAFFVDEQNSEINIVQCKSCASEKNKKALKKEWLSFLNDAPGKLENHDLIDNHSNARIKEIAEDYIKFKSKGYTVKLHFFHLGNADKNALNHYEDSIDYYGWERIKEEYQEYLSKIDRTEPPSIDIELAYDRMEPNFSKQHKTLVSIITGDEIVNLRQQYRYKLFDKNLRFGLGKNKINKGITKTAISEPENFYFFNNGITITSKGFRHRPTSGSLRIDYPQIINGAQTVNAIYEAFKELKNKLARKNPSCDADADAKKEFSRIKLLFRVIQDEEKDGKKTSVFEENVIRFNNSQNSIKETDFYANNPEQIKLQELFSKDGYFYETKRGDRKYLEAGKEEHNLLKMKKNEFENWEEKLDIEKMASIWMAYKVDPALDKIQKRNIFGYASDKYYDTVFKKAELITEDEVREMILAWNLFSLISEQSDIYGKTAKKGQIISKVLQFSEESNSANSFSNIRKIIEASFLFGSEVKKCFATPESFLIEKEELIQHIKKYHFFSMGKYMTLAITKLIIDECGYKNGLIQDTPLYKDKQFIKKYMIKPWLEVILDELLIKEYNDFERNVGSSLQTFYVRNSTWESMKKKLRSLKFEKDKPLNEIFPLDLSKTHNK